MKVLVDTSVWSAALRSTPPKVPTVVERLRKFVLRGDVVLLGIILQELLQGFRAEKSFVTATRNLAAFPLLQLRRGDYVAAADLRRSCASRGIVASTIDCQIAAAAIQNRCALLTTDEDFAHIARVSKLKLV